MDPLLPLAALLAAWRCQTDILRPFGQWLGSQCWVVVELKLSFISPEETMGCNVGVRVAVRLETETGPKYMHSTVLQQWPT